MEKKIDKRVKLSMEDKLKIKNLFNPENHLRFNGASKIAKEFGVSRRTIDFIFSPEKLIINRQNAKGRKLNITKSEAQIKLEFDLKIKKKEEYNRLNPVKILELENTKKLKIIERENARNLKIIERNMEKDIRQLNKKLFRERRLEEMKSLRKAN